MAGYAGKEGFVYFITTERVGVVKIGFATDVSQRLYNLQCATFLDLSVFDAFPARFEDEGIIKDLFSPFRIRGEWFRFHDYIYDFIEDAEDYRREFFERHVFDRSLHTTEEMIIAELDRVPITGFLKEELHG